MRPDEHKKRKNAQYKKKHGMSAKGNEPTTKGQDVPKVEQTNETKSEVATAKNETVNTLKGATPVPELDEREQDFRRRGLVSNWSRYDERLSDSDDELPDQRGEDFNKLLSAAGGAGVQFRFRDEEDWDVSADSGSPSVGGSLDLEDLATSLACIPLHTRLGLQDDLFSEEQLQEFSAVADKNKALHDSLNVTNKQETSNKLENKAKDNANKRQCTLIPSKSIKKDVDVQQKSITVNSVNNGMPEHSMVDDQLDDILAETDRKAHSLTVKPPDVKTKSNSIVPNLPVKVNSNKETSNKDSLNLSSDSLMIKLGGDINKNKASTVLEDDIDFLLSLDSPPGHVAGKSKDCVPKVDSRTNRCLLKSDIKPEDDNLTDWLDSMLDD